MITKRGRFWAVTDPAGALVCACVYKRGAVEVARRVGAQAVPPARNFRPRMPAAESTPRERRT